MERVGCARRLVRLLFRLYSKLAPQDSFALLVLLQRSAAAEVLERELGTDSVSISVRSLSMPLARNDAASERGAADVQELL